jgi:hypothetical protein
MRRVGEPDDVEILRTAIRSRMADVRTSIPGIVKSYDDAMQTCEVSLAVRIPGPDGTLEELKPLADVPVAWPRGGGYFAQMPLAAGDPVLLVFCEMDFGAWRTSGAVSDPISVRRHGLNAYAIPGGCDDASALPAPGGKLVVGKVGGPVMKIDAAGIELGAAASAFVALADKVNEELGKIADAFTSFIPGSGGASFSMPYTTAGDVSATKVKAE